MLEIKFNPKLGIWTKQPEAIEKLHRNWFGQLKKGKIWLQPEEALYLIAFQNASVKLKTKKMGFNELATYFAESDPRLFIKYSAYRDWRDRGLVIKRAEDVKKPRKLKRPKGLKTYHTKPLKPKKTKVQACWYKDSLFSVIDKEVLGKRLLFEKYWFGQFGVYKQTRGNLLKLNFFETIFLAKHFGIKIKDIKTGKKITYKQILKEDSKLREFSKTLYEVYEEWRLGGYIVKSGFKFGAHFRIYFPGASPVGEYIHSKHVLHIFPPEQKLLISEWARAVRVAHGVKKTFLLAIPEVPEKGISSQAYFLAWRRKKEKAMLVRETPQDRPRYLLVPVAEDEHISGLELAKLLQKAQDLGLELLLSIVDRETAITYYALKLVKLPGSKYEYYEIEWMKP